MVRTLARIALVLLAVATLYVATTAGYPVTHEAVSGFFRDTLHLGPEAEGVWTTVVRKAFHLPAYALLAMLAYLALPAMKRRGWWALGLTLSVALADEALQALHPARTGRPLDLLVDAVGAGIGVWVASRLTRRTSGT